MRYEVKKMQYGINGKLFSHPSKRFANLESAREYAESFANDQRDVPGTFVVVKQRKGDRTLTQYTCGSEFCVSNFDN